MLRVDKPYFMNDKEWYYYDEKEFKYKLTQKAPNKAVESYNKYYNEFYNETIIDSSKEINLMDDYFNVEYVRNELIEELKKQGYSQEKIDELIKICDTAYNDYKIPYPTIEEILNR